MAIKPEGDIVHQPNPRTLHVKWSEISLKFSPNFPHVVFKGGFVPRGEFQCMDIAGLIWGAVVIRNYGRFTRPAIYFLKSSFGA